VTTGVGEGTSGTSLPWEEFFRAHRAVMLLIDPDDGAIVDANPAACAWYGWTREELCSRRISDINTLPPDEVRARMEQARREECEFFDFRHRLANGSVRDIVAYTTRVQLGGRTLLHSIIQDVTERVRSREVLRRTEHMRDVSERAAGIGSFVWPLDGGPASWSSEVYELFDVRPGEFGYDLPRAVAGRVLPDDQAPLMAMLREVAEREELVSMEVRVPARGEERVMRVGGVPEYDAGGAVVAVAGYVQDVTEQRRAEHELRLAYDRLDIAQQAAGAGAFEFHADTRDFTFSPQMYELFGLDPEADAGSFETLRAVVHPDDAAAVWEAYASALSDHTQLQVEYRIVRPSDGEVRWIDSLGHGVYDDADRPVSLIGLCIDVTGRKQTGTLLGVPSEILSILAEGGHVEEMARKIVDAIQHASGFSAVGLRLRDGDDFPFIAATGYEAGFIEAEDALTSPAAGGGLCREADGSVSLDCTCGLVIHGPGAPGDPMFTPGGSVWTNDSRVALEALQQEDPRLRPRNRCVHVGFRCIALVPVRAGDRTLGLLHLADERTGCFSADSIRFFEGLGASIGNALLRRQVEEELEASALELRGQLSDTVKAMGAIVGLRDPYTAAHEHRVTLLALAIAEELGLDEERCEGLALAGEVHDIGKIAVPAEILTKPSRLSAVEFTMISQHAETGREILGAIDFREPVADIVAQHHERLDGSGYPAGLTGDDILEEARILAVADVVEAMASHRPYRPGLGLDAALEEVRSGAGVRFDAAAVEACERVFAAGFSLPEE
jgi:PAS domain S-box-containing protein/putative nucleotidyltransferase with HDIG domain